MPNGAGGVGSLIPSSLRRCSAVAGRGLSTPETLSFESEFIGFAPCSATMLADEFSQVIFCFAGFAKASPNQPIDPLLCGWSCHRSDASVPPGFDFDIRRQTSEIDKAPGVHDCAFVEGGDSAGERIDKSVEVSIRQRPIHIAIELGQVAWDVVRTQNHFQGAPSSHETRQLQAEEHTSELQLHLNLVCRLLLEKKKAVRTSRAARNLHIDFPPCKPARELGSTLSSALIVPARSAHLSPSTSLLYTLLRSSAA